MSIKLIASDLDGTIVGDDNIVSEENLKAISKINSKKINFAICTGKTYQITKSFCQEFDAKYGIFNNGSQIFDLSTGEKLYSSFLSYDNIKTLIDFAKENHFHVHVYSDYELISEKLKYLDLRNFKLLKSSGFKFVIVDDILDYIQKNNTEINQLVLSANRIPKEFKTQIKTLLPVSCEHISKLR